MVLSFFQCIIYSLISALTDILPVSAEAHRILFFKIYGLKAGDTAFLDMMIHLGILGGLYFSNMTHITRIAKARHLARIPKRRRRRPLDTRSLMDFSLLRFMVIPVIISLILVPKVEGLRDKMPLLALFLLLNGIILYIPQTLPSGNRDARNINPFMSLAIGLCNGFSIIPGISAMGTTTASAYAFGIDRKYGLDMALLLQMAVVIGYIVYDIMAIASVGMGSLTFLLFLQFLVCGILAAVTCVFAVRLMRFLAANYSFGIFGFYCIGLALFTFILNLLA